MSLSRFYLPPSDWSEGELRLSGGEAGHCAQVLRKQVGDVVEVFDGQGRVARCTLSQVSRNSVTMDIESVTQFSPLEPRLHLIAAIIKGDRMDYLIEKSVELGAASVAPVHTDNCVVRLNSSQGERKTEKWRQAMIAAAKQCHIPFLPVLHPPQTMSTAFATVPEGGLRLIAALDEQQHTMDAVIGTSEPHDITVVIGPEGDFTPEELRLARDQGFRAVTLGPLILRAETAAITALARLSRHRRGLREAPPA